MTAEERSSCIESADHWDQLADSDERKAARDRALGIDGSEPGDSAGDHRARQARACAKSLRLQAVAGVNHCICHHLPRTRYDGRGCPNA